MKFIFLRTSPLRLQHGPDSKFKAWELVRPRAKPNTSFATRTFSFNQECDSVRVWTQATTKRRWNTHAHWEKIRDCTGGWRRWNTHAHFEKFRDCACVLRSRRESDHRGEDGRPEGGKRVAHRASIVLRQWAWESKFGTREKTYKEGSKMLDKNRKENQGEL